MPVNITSVVPLLLRNVVAGPDLGLNAIGRVGSSIKRPSRVLHISNLSPKGGGGKVARHSPGVQTVVGTVQLHLGRTSGDIPSLKEIETVSWSATEAVHTVNEGVVSG